jgi:hypothetical protein
MNSSDVRGNSPFDSFFLAGFECSAQQRRDGRRLDLLDSTGHARWAATDYEMVRAHGLGTVRDGLRWHLIERESGRYDWTSFLPMLHAARETGVQVVWDLCHYGCPESVDVWSASFPERFGRFAAEAARVIVAESERAPLVCPINEISFWAWAGGDVGQFGPSSHGRGMELKRQLVRASIAAIEAVRAVAPDARFVCAEPVIHVDPGASSDPVHAGWAEHFRKAQFEAIDLLTGRLEPELGGRPEYLDLVGLNFYPDNQWYHGGPTIPLGHHAYRPLHQMLLEWAERYRRPLFLAETGSEGSARAAWLHYVCAEIRVAQARGVPIEGICIYPILDYAGWEDERICTTGLLSMPDRSGRRAVFEPLAEELRRQQILFRQGERSRRWRPDLMVAAE